MSYLYRKILLYIQMLFFFSSTGVLGTEYIAKTATEHGMMCGCKNIFLVRHFDATGVEITPNATWQTTVTYGGSAGSYSVLTPDAGPYSTFSIPDDIVDCYMKGRLSRLSAYYKTDKGEFFEVAGEYKVSGVSHTIQSIRTSGAPFWKKFDFYFDFIGITSEIKDVKLNIKSSKATVPVYIDEMVICTFCDGAIEQNGPNLTSLAVTPGTWNTPFKPDEYSYTIKVAENVNTVNITPVYSGSGSPEIRIKGSVVTSGSTAPVTIGTTESVPIDINLRQSTCVQANYVLYVNKNIAVDATLADLVSTIGHFTNAFDRNILNYQLIVPYGTTTLKLRPLATDPTSTITVNGLSVKTGTESNEIDITTITTITIIVTAKDGVTTRTYSVNVNEEGPEISFLAESGTGLESVTNPVITVKINPAPDVSKTYSIQYNVDAASTASGGGVDFTLSNGSLSFDNTHTTRTIPLTIINDAILGEGAETVILKLLNPTNGAKLGTPNVYTYTVGEVIYVKSGCTGNGSSWVNAYGSLQDAIALAVRGSEIWIAGASNATGMIYKPGPVGSPRTVCFAPRAGVSMIGGFPGNAGEEGRRDLQNWSLYKTILDGDLAGDDGTVWPPALTYIDDNAYNVVKIDNMGLEECNKILLNGLRIRNGNSNYGLGDVSRNTGGGILIFHSNVIISQCNIVKNQAVIGGGLGIYSSKVYVQNSTIETNRSQVDGGGLAVGSKSIGILYSEATLQNNTIVNNSAGEGWGGGVCLYDPENTLIENTVIARNHADLQGGGGMHVNWVRCNVLNLQNCSFVANSAYLSGGGLSALYGGSSQVCNTAPLHIANTIFSENQIENLEGASEISVDNRDGSTPAIIGYSAISGGISSTNCQGVVKPGVGNIDCIPDFLSSTNYQIGSGSNCIDRGTAVESPTTDLEGKMRYDEPSHPNLPSFIDIGAYEYNP